MAFDLKSFGFKITGMCHDHRLLEDGVQALCRRFREQDFLVTGPIPIPTRNRLFTVLSSPFVYKKARFQTGLNRSKRLFLISKDKPVEGTSILAIIKGCNISEAIKLRIVEYDL